MSSRELAQLIEHLAAQKTTNDQHLLRLLKSAASSSLLDELLLIGLRDRFRRLREAPSRNIAGDERRARQVRDAEYAAAHGIPVNLVSDHKARAHFRAAEDIFEKTAWDRAVELLDHWIVGGKPLGDCTRSDLIKAAGHARQIADSSTQNAAVYEQLAQLIGTGTVRETNLRREVVSILRGRLPEHAA